jgi:N-acetylglucosamine malate deacetylase 2
MNLRLTRRRFAWMAAAAAFGPQVRAQPSQETAREAPLKAVGIVAHPDDEFTFAATAYRFARELGGTMDQVVISNGEAGYRYSLLAEQVYGLALTDEEVGRAHLPEIRKQETLAAGRILGIRHHYFLNQKDAGYTLDADDVSSVWDEKAVRAFLSKLLAQEQYSYVFTVLPSADTHGHHKAATLLTLEVVSELPGNRRPVVLGADPASSHDPVREFVELPHEPLTRTGPDLREFNRSRSFGFRNALNYQIVVNWVIAEHKSQGLFQMDAGRYDVERFWRFEVSGPQSQEAADRLFERLNGPRKSD